MLILLGITKHLISTIHFRPRPSWLVFVFIKTARERHL